MTDHERVRRMTDSLAELFPERKNELEKEKYYYDHNYYTFLEWENGLSLFQNSLLCI